MSPWLYLLLAHLIADFVLQPYELVKLKQRPVGLAIHAGIHALVTAVVAAPILPRWWLAVPLLGVAHYAIDHLKVRSGRTAGPASMAAFLGDQGAHLAVLAVAVWLGGLPLRGQVSLASPAITAALYYAIPYLTVTFAGAILVYQLALAYQTRPQPATLLNPRQRVVGYTERGLLLTLILFVAPAFWVIGAAWYGLRLSLDRRGAGAWMELGGSLTLTAALGLLFRQGAGL